MRGTRPADASAACGVWHICRRRHGNHRHGGRKRTHPAAGRRTQSPADHDLRHRGDGRARVAQRLQARDHRTRRKRHQRRRHRDAYGARIQVSGRRRDAASRHGRFLAAHRVRGCLGSAPRTCRNRIHRRLRRGQPALRAGWGGVCICSSEGRRRRHGGDSRLRAAQFWHGD